MPGAQAVAGEEDLRIALALADVVVGTLEQLNGSPGAEIGTADANDHEHIGFPADFLRGHLDSADLLGCLPNGQVQPAQKVVARAGAVHQGIMGIGNFLLHCQQIRQRQLTPDVGNIYFNHVGKTRPFLLFQRGMSRICYRNFPANASPFVKTSFYGDAGGLGRNCVGFLHFPLAISCRICII